MLQPSFYESAPVPVMRILSELNIYTITEIARRIHALDQRRQELGLDDYDKLISSNVYRIERLQAIDIFGTDFKAALVEATGKTMTEIDILFENSAIEAHNFDRATFAERLNRFVADEKIGHLSAEDIQRRAFSAGIKPFVEYKDNAFLQQITRAAAEQTKSTFSNLTRSIGFTTRDGRFLPPRETFTNALTLGEMKVVTGIADYNSVIKEIVRELSDSGLKAVEYPFAKPWSLESSVRTNILTGIAQLSGEVTLKNAEDLGATHVGCTAHDGSRESHMPWQGRIFALNGSVAEIRAKADEIREADKGVRAMRRAEKAAQNA